VCRDVSQRFAVVAVNSSRQQHALRASQSAGAKTRTVARFRPGLTLSHGTELRNQHGQTGNDGSQRRSLVSAQKSHARPWQARFDELLRQARLGADACATMYHSGFQQSQSTEVGGNNPWCVAFVCAKFCPLFHRLSTSPDAAA